MHKHITYSITITTENKYVYTVLFTSSICFASCFFHNSGLFIIIQRLCQIIYMVSVCHSRHSEQQKSSHRFFSQFAWICLFIYFVPTFFRTSASMRTGSVAWWNPNPNYVSHLHQIAEKRTFFLCAFVSIHFQSFYHSVLHSANTFFRSDVASVFFPFTIHIFRFEIGYIVNGLT